MPGRVELVVLNVCCWWKTSASLLQCSRSTPFLPCLPAFDYKNIFKDFMSCLCGSQFDHFRREKLSMIGDPEAKGQLFWTFFPACGSLFKPKSYWGSKFLCYYEIPLCAFFILISTGSNSCPCIWITYKHNSSVRPETQTSTSALLGLLCQKSLGCIMRGMPGHHWAFPRQWTELIPPTRFPMNTGNSISQDGEMLVFNRLPTANTTPQSISPRRGWLLFLAA